MHRTQILLQPSQYRQLKARAAKSHISLGQLVRRLIDRFLSESESRQKSSLAQFAGVFEDKECQSTNYRKHLYSHAD